MVLVSLLVGCGSEEGGSIDGDQIYQPEQNLSPQTDVYVSQDSTEYFVLGYTRPRNGQQLAMITKDNQVFYYENYASFEYKTGHFSGDYGKLYRANLNTNTLYTFGGNDILSAPTKD